MNFEVYQISIIFQNWGDDPDVFFIQAQFEIRQIGNVGGESFALKVVSPKAFGNEFGNDLFEYEFGRGYFFSNEFDETKVLASIQKLVDRIDANSWEKLIVEVDKYFPYVE